MSLFRRFLPIIIIPVGQKLASGYEGDYWSVSNYQHLKWIADHNTDGKTVTTHFPIRGYMKTNYLMLTEEQKEQVRIPSVDTDYQIVWLSAPMDYYWIDSETGAEPVIEGYEEVNPIFSYGIKLSSLYQKTQQ